MLSPIDTILEESFCGRYKGETGKQYLIAMVDFLHGSRDSDDARAVLLRYYSSECMAHGAYIIAIAVGVLSFIGLFPNIWSLATFSRVLLLGLISSVLATLAIYILGRAFFWGYLAYSVIFVIPKKEGEVEVKEGTTKTSLLLLHRACTEYVKEKHEFAGWFYSSRIWEMTVVWFVLFVGLKVVWLALSL